MTHEFIEIAFTCAYQKDIAIQGKLYVTQNRLCFHSNILGFVTVVGLVKDMTQ
jgi:hypothetical protein